MSDQHPFPGDGGQLQHRVFHRLNTPRGRWAVLFVLTVLIAQATYRFMNAPHASAVTVAAYKASAVLIWLVVLGGGWWIVIRPRPVSVRRKVPMTLSFLLLFLALSYFPVFIGVTGPVADVGFVVAVTLLVLSFLLMVVGFWSL